MKKIFLGFLVVITSSLFSQETLIQISEITLKMPSHIFWKFGGILILLAICVFIFWIYEEIKDNKVFNKVSVKFHSSLQKYMQEHNGVYVSNLRNSYSQIDNSKDIYFISGNLILKTGNTTNNGNYEPPGYTLKISKIKYYYWLFIIGMRVTLSFAIFSYIGLILWGLIIVMILIGKMANVLF